MKGKVSIELLSGWLWVVGGRADEVAGSAPDNQQPATHDPQHPNNTCRYYEVAKACIVRNSSGGRKSFVRAAVTPPPGGIPSVPQMKSGHLTSWILATAATILVVPLASSASG